MMLVAAAVWLSLTGYVFTSPGSLTLTFHVAEPAKHKDQQLCYAISDGVPTISCFPFDGKYVTQKDVKNIPAGDYKVWFQLGKEQSAPVQFIVR